MQTKPKIPSVGTILGWLGIISALLGIVAFFFGDFRSIFGLNPPARSLTDEQIVATLNAFQQSADRANLQLTQYAIQQQAAANQGTRTAIDAQQAAFQATVTAVQAQQEAFVATQNAFGALTATAGALNDAATQGAQNATGTAAAIAQIPPTNTPFPTPTATPAPVADYRSLTGADVQQTNKGIVFSVQTAENIPDAPQGVSYVWLLDTDRNPATGQTVQDIGVDKRIAIRFDNGNWIGTARDVGSDGSLGDPLFFVNIRIKGPSASAEIDPGQLGLPTSFDWIARSEGETEVYPFFPLQGHSTLQ